MDKINVVINGILGKMGQEVAKAVSQESDMCLSGGVDITAGNNTKLDNINVYSNLNEIANPIDVVIDFTNSEGAETIIRESKNHGYNIVIGSTGIPEQVITDASNIAKEKNIGIVIAPNFAIGAVLMSHLAKIAGPFFEYADLTEMHHEAKIDAPSGTAIAIANATLENKTEPFTNTNTEKEILPGTRGYSHNGIIIHSVRMPGRIAHHELVFGAPGQTLTIRHDSIGRESFMPGVILAARTVMKEKRLIKGLEELLGLKSN
jgi:4-hydroxy-tetrahydrodipicolinate reductase